MALFLSSLKTEVQTRKYGKLRLRYLSMNDSIYMDELARQDLRPREFAAQLLHHQLEIPALELAEMRAWPRSLLLRVARAWAANPHALHVELSEKAPLVALQQAAAAHMAAQQRHRREAFSQMQTIQSDALGQITALHEMAFHATATHLADSLRQTLEDAQFGRDWMGLARPNTVDPLSPALWDLGARINPADWIGSKLTEWGTATSLADLMGPKLEDLGITSRLSDLLGSHLDLQTFGIEATMAAMDAASTSAWAKQLAETEARLREMAFDGIQGTLAVVSGVAGLTDHLHDWVGDAARTAWEGLGGAQHWADLIRGIEIHIPKISADPIPEIRDGSQRIESAGFGFIADLMPMNRIFRIGRVSRRVAHAVVTWSLLATTRSDFFVWRLYYLYTGSPTLRSLWPALVEAIDNHRRGQYYSSISTLLPLVEGVLSDGLELEGRIMVQNNERIVMNQGQVKRNKHGDPVKLPGMHALAHQADFHNQAALNQAAALVADRLASERNVILHGHFRNYGTAARSVRCLLLLWVLGLWVAELEGIDLEYLHPHRLN